MIRIFYHSADLDGICSAAILYQKYKDATLYPINYGQAVPWQDITDKDTVYMVDFSLPPEQLFRMARACSDFHWIDHHKTAIEAYNSYRSEHPEHTYAIRGWRSDEAAGCEWTWTYVHDGALPRSVQLLGRYDVWDHSDPDTMPFQYGMRLLDLRPFSPMWNDILADKGLDDIVKQGRAILQYQRQNNRRSVSSGAFLCTIGPDRTTVVACNGTGGSELFKDADPQLLAKAEACLTFQYSGKTGEWVYGIYHLEGKTDIDVSAIAKHYKGGGHKGASGFKLDLDIVTKERLVQ